MQTPTKSQWQIVIGNYEKVLAIASKKGSLNMAETEVNDSGLEGINICGTVHCVAGWYAVATLDPANTSKRISFTDGADRMAQDLGLSDRDALEIWARDNANIWGNEKGYYMFSSSGAYDYAQTLAEVVAHLKGVRDRSPN
jgi:hypothetical protein